MVQQVLHAVTVTLSAIFEFQFSFLMSSSQDIDTSPSSWFEHSAKMLNYLCYKEDQKQKQFNKTVSMLSIRRCIAVSN